MRRALVVLAMLLLAAPADARSLTERNRAVVTAFAHRFYDLHDVRGAFERYVAPHYIQHNPHIADGRDAAIAALEPIFGPDSRFEIKRIVVDGDLAVIHLHGSTGKGGAVADIFRLKCGRIVEHWDVLQPIEDSPVNPHPYF